MFGTTAGVGRVSPPRSTAFNHLDTGDLVALRWRGVTYSCVELISPAHTPPGTRGSVAHSALRSPR